MGKRIVMVGTCPDGKGGIASVVSVYRRHGLFARFDIRYVVSHRERDSLGKLRIAVTAGAKLLWLLATGQVSVVHAQVASYGSFKRKAVYLAMARAFSVPTVFHLHGAEFRKFTDELASPALRRRIVTTLQRSTAVIALSDSWADYLRSIAPGARVTAVANPVYLPGQPDREHEQAGRVLFLGRADQRKGVFDLLEAFAAVRARHPAATLGIGGDGDLGKVRARVAELGLQDCVDVLGWLGSEAKQEQLARAQVFVLPSYDEGLPMAMLESMAHGKAMVVTPVGGIPEAVQHGAQGLLVPPGQVDQLVEALQALLSDAALRERLGNGARQRVAERFSTEHVLAQLGVLYESLGLRPQPESPV
jgi:glycosyltransferase involved in cell wall biosynthesis